MKDEELAGIMFDMVDNMPKDSFWDYLPIRKGLAKLIPNFIYSWAWHRKYPD